MIDSQITAKAMYDKLKAFCVQENLELVVWGSSKTLDPNTIYIKENLLDNDEASVGMESTSSDIEFPIYQIDILTPKANTKWKNIEIQNKVREEFKKAEFVYRGATQTVQIQTVNKSGVIFSDTHAISNLSVNLTVIASNT